MCAGIALPNATPNTSDHDAGLVRWQAEDSAGLAKFVNEEQNLLLEADSGGTTQVTHALESVIHGNLISHRRSGASSFHHGVHPERRRGDALSSMDRAVASQPNARAWR